VLIFFASLGGLVCCCGFCIEICCPDENKPIKEGGQEIGDEDVRLEMTSMLTSTHAAGVTTTTEEHRTFTTSNGKSSPAPGWTSEVLSNEISKCYVVVNDMPK
jgi:hypothetical protein